jgi:hypothetical protein
MNQNISRVIKTVVFIFIVLITDKGLGLNLRKLYFNQTAGQNSSLNYVFSKCNADILIFGNSRAQHHYDSRIISSALKMSCFNAGQDGGHSILLPYALIKVLTERYSPKIIILEFFTDEIVHYEGDYDRLSILLPYYKEYPEIRTLIKLRSPYEGLKLMSSIYPFNSNIINIIRFNTNTHSAHKQDFEGYIPLTGVMSNDMLKPATEIIIPSVVDTNMVNSLENIMRLCSRKNINLFIITSPVFHTINEKQSSPSSISELTLEIIHRNQANYLDFSFDSTFTGHIEWFRDKWHLNDEGAKIFSNMLIDSISKTIGTYAKNETNLDNK